MNTTHGVAVESFFARLKTALTLERVSNLGLWEAWAKELASSLLLRRTYHLDRLR